MQGTTQVINTEIDIHNFPIYLMLISNYHDIAELKKRMNEVKERSGMLSMHMWEIEPVPILPHKMNEHKRMKLDHDTSPSEEGYRSRFESVPGYRPPETANRSHVPSSSSVHSLPSSSSQYGTGSSGSIYGPGGGGSGGIYGPDSGYDYSPTPSPKNKDKKKEGKKSKRGISDPPLTLEETRINQKRANRFKNDFQYVNQRPTSVPVYSKVEPGTVLTEEDLVKMKIIGIFRALNFRFYSTVYFILDSSFFVLSRYM